jgi:hypothetical protein
MLKAVEATIETNGETHLLEPVHVAHSCRALVTIIEKRGIFETASRPRAYVLSGSRISALTR